MDRQGWYRVVLESPCCRRAIHSSGRVTAPGDCWGQSPRVHKDLLGSPGGTHCPVWGWRGIYWCTQGPWGGTHGHAQGCWEGTQSCARGS